MKKIVICGDSFNIGIGCWDLKTEPYGALLADHLKLEQVNLAKGSASPVNIFLQVKYAVEKFDDIDYLIMSSTTYDRFDWFPEGYYVKDEISLLDVNYHEYPPYKPGIYVESLPNPIGHEPGYRGGMFTETPAAIMKLMDLIRKWQKDPASKEFDGGYWFKFKSSDPSRITSLYEYMKKVYDPYSNKIKVRGTLVMGHALLKKKGIKHLILSHEPHMLTDYIDEENLCKLNWYELAQHYPDNMPPPGHTNQTGHEVAFNTVIQKFRDNGWI